MYYATPFEPRPSDAAPRGLIVAAGLGRLGPGMSLALGETHHDVRVFTRITSARRELVRILPDTVVVGLDEGMTAAADLLSEARTGGVRAVLTLVDGPDPYLVDEALAAGAHDVVAPPHSARAILLRRRVLLQSPIVEPPSASLKRRVVLGPLTVDLTSRQVLDGTAPLTLSGREFELLVRLMEGHGDVVSRTCLLADIWGKDQGSEAVLDATVHRLRRKLEEKLDDEQLITTVRGVGYRLRARTQPLTAVRA